MNYITRAFIKNKIFLTSDIVEFIFVPDIKVKYNPGSFLQLTLDNVTASQVWPESRTFSIACYDFSTLRIIVKREGNYTNRIINETNIGQSVTLKYPFGDLYSKKNDSKNHVFIAGGVGITPFIGLAEYLSKIGNFNTKLFYSAKRAQELFYVENFKSQMGNTFFFTTQEQSIFINRRIMISDILASHNSAANTNYYVSGTKQFINYFRTELIRKGIKNIYFDDWE